MLLSGVAPDDSGDVCLPYDRGFGGMSDAYPRGDVQPLSVSSVIQRIHMHIYNNRNGNRSQYPRVLTEEDIVSGYPLNEFKRLAWIIISICSIFVDYGTPTT